MSEVTRDPEAVATELAGKLSARTRHVCVLLGAGASRSAGLPDLGGLQDAVKSSSHLTAPAAAGNRSLQDEEP
jgi:NAD-dependent SIR2 family protein deacetylase